MKAKLIQLTNKAVGNVKENSYMPLGVITVVYPGQSSCDQTYSITSSNSDTLVVNKSGTYRFIYNASLLAATEGNIVLSILLNGVELYKVTTAVASGNTVNVTIPYEVYIPCNCCNNPNNVPAYLQVYSSGVEITSGMSNLIMDKE